MKLVNRIVVNGNKKTIEEFRVFDDLKEYLDHYLGEHVSFSRIGYGEWKTLVIDNQRYYSLWIEDYDKVTEKLWKELLDYADKEFTIYITSHKYMGNQGNCRFTGVCKTVEEAVEKSIKMANDSIENYQKQINELQLKIDHLKNLDHSKLVKTDYSITYPKMEYTKNKLMKVGNE